MWTDICHNIARIEQTVHLDFNEKRMLLGSEELCKLTESLIGQLLTKSSRQCYEQCLEALVCLTRRLGAALLRRIDFCKNFLRQIVKRALEDRGN